MQRRKMDWWCQVGTAPILRELTVILLPELALLQAGQERAGGLPSLLTEEALSKLALPPAVLRRAQQLPGVIPLPNGAEVRGTCPNPLTICLP